MAGRLLVRLWFCLCVAVGALALAPPGLADYAPPGLGNDAEGYAQSIRAKAPPQSTDAQRAEAVKRAHTAFARKDMAAAVTAVEQSIALGTDEGPAWLALSDAWLALPTPNRDRALQSAFLAYQNGTPEVQAAALWRLADLFDGVFGSPAEALRALRAIQEIPDLTPEILQNRTPGLEARVTGLRLRLGLTLASVNVDAESSPPRACFRFADPLSERKEIRFADFVRVEPAVKGAVDARGSTLCVSGLSHGASYAVTLRQGLPGADGLALKADETHTVRVPDRAPSVAFRGSGFILPRTGNEGVPVVTVNLEQVKVTVFRVNDRNVAPNLRYDRILEPLREYSAGEIADDWGEKVWEGRLTTAGDRNREITTLLPFRQAVPEPKPGFYAVMAEPVDVPESAQPYVRATQWLLVSDIGLTAYRGADGITVFARSFGTARPMAGVEVALVARNNTELGRATTDADGRAGFAAGLTRGAGGSAPVSVMAYAGADFAALDLTAAAFDLSDRGVGGRPQPGPMDAFLYTDRGVYRQGETVNVTVLLRDAQTEAVEGFPLTVKVLRPSGTEYWSGTPAPGPAGSYVLPLSLSRTAPLGGWTVQAFTDPKGEPVGSVPFQVDDFVPERLAVDLTPAAPVLEAGKPFQVLAKGRFLYGPAAAGLPGTAELLLRPDPTPYPQHKEYRFGLVQERFDTRLEPLTFPDTDAQGEARIDVTLPPLPDTTRPLRAEVRVALSEPGGRPTRQSVTVPVRAQAYAIGIRPRFDGARLGEGEEASFDVIALAPDGTPIAKAGLSWSLVEERTTYQWYMRDGRYTYRAFTRDAPAASGTADIAAGTPAVIAAGKRPVGRYRLEVADTATGVASSLRFSSGWVMDSGGGDTPDTLELIADKPAYVPGDTARLKITPPFAGEVLVTVATDRVWGVKTLSVPATGGSVEIPVDAAWGPGAYVVATAYRPPVAGKERQPVRAIGVAWLGIDPAVRRLDVAFADPPAVARPRQPVELALTIAPAAGGRAEEAWVTLAAVDEGILQLTDFTSPDPGRHYFGKRLLGLDLRDDYGRLLEVLDGPFGGLRQGGDSSGAALPVVPFTVVSLFSGPVKVGADGLARVTLDIPDFNGELRLMAVGFGKGRLGAASATLTVRDPLVADAVMPRFLAPGDDSRLTVSLHNVEAAAGTYRVAVTGSGGVAVDNGTQDVDLPAGERRTLSLPFRGVQAGVGSVALAVTGPGGFAVRHDYGITVRPSRPVETRFVTRQLAPGASADLNATVLAGFMPGTGRVAATFSAAPPFDLAGILQALDRYPYGCTEQTVSRALPLLVVRDVEAALGRGDGTDTTLEGRVAEAVARVLDRQRYDGSFGLWSATGDTDAWLSAYAMEFLIRARNGGYAVPDQPVRNGLDWLRRHLVDGGREPADLASRAYALHVLALGGVPVPGSARYLHDAFLDQMPTPLSKGQMGAALARLGDAGRAESAFAAAAAHLNRKPWGVDYGSTVRDAAALLVVMGEVRMLDGRLQTLVDRLSASETTAKQTSTQEQAWIVMAADTLMRGKAPLRLTVTGAAGAGTGDPVIIAPPPDVLAQGVRVANAGTEAVWQAVSLSGIPAQPGPAAREGLRIKRTFFTRGGEPLNLDQIHQNDVFVIVLEGEASTGLDHRAIVVHPLPAGWEIENPHLGGADTGDLPWLTDITLPQTVEARDDRYVAAVDLGEDQPRFKLAYLVRAVTPGIYELPGAQVEDMYKPRFFARQAVGRITVLPAP